MARMPSVRLASVLLVCLATAVPATPGYTQPISADAISKAKSNCLSAVARLVNRPRNSLRIIKARGDTSGVYVDIQVPTAQAPWSCLTSPKGEVEDVHFN